MGFIGRSVPRIEDGPLVTGRGRFAADVGFAHQLHMRVVRSAHAHGRIVSIDTNAAKAAPGVAAVWTSADVADVPPIDFRLTRVEGLDPYRQPILATDRVRYVGEPVAVVFATDPYLAEDAADLVTIEVADLPVLLDATSAPSEFDNGHSTEVDVAAQRLWRHRRRVRCCARRRRTRSRHRPPYRRAAGDARRHRAGGARHSRNARRRQGAALEPGLPCAHAQPRALLRASARRPCRRRLRHPRRTLSRGRARLSRRAAAQSPGEMDRRPPRASDGGESFAPAEFCGARRGRCRRSAARHRRHVLSRPGRVCAHARRDRARSCRRDAARPLSDARLSHDRPHPADQQNAVRHLSGARALREHVRARAADGCDCGQA